MFALIRFIVGVVLGAAVMFAWGFFYWGGEVIDLPYQAWKVSSDDAAAAEALAAHFPETGTYHVPSMTHPREELEEMLNAGPVAMVHIEHGGCSMEDPKMMYHGAYHCLAATLALAFVLRAAGTMRSNFAQRVTCTIMTGLAAAVLIDGGDAVWWSQSWAWTFAKAGYHVSAFILAGVVLAAFIGPPKFDDTERPEGVPV